MATRVMVLVGTRKGAFIVESDRDRAKWNVRGPYCETWPVLHMSYDEQRSVLYAGSGSEWFGPSIWRSADLGQTWTQSSEGLTYGDEGPKVKKVWNVIPVNGSIYAGVDPAGLFRSNDGGQTWAHVAGLREHPSCADWQPGNGGLCLHTIVPHPQDHDRLWVGISAVGTFETRDGGRTWQTRNRGVRADFLPDPYPEYGHCVHKIGMAASEPEWLYQQNHCGVYRSRDGGQTWEEITEGLPSRFGFPLAAHPHDRHTFYLAPLEENGRFMPGAAGQIWRTRNGGDSWECLNAGLPQQHAYLGVLRDALGVDTLDTPGVYFGTTTGQLYRSRDEGKTWSLLAPHLPPINSVAIAVVDE